MWLWQSPSLPRHKGNHHYCPYFRWPTTLVSSHEPLTVNTMSFCSVAKNTQWHPPKRREHRSTGALLRQLSRRCYLHSSARLICQIPTVAKYACSTKHNLCSQCIWSVLKCKDLLKHREPNLAVRHANFQLTNLLQTNFHLLISKLLENKACNIIPDIWMGLEDQETFP